MELNLEQLNQHSRWDKMGVSLPHYAVDKVAGKTKEAPTWVHFGAGNIFRGFIASLQQRLLNTKKSETGIVAVETYDEEIISKIYEPYDNLTMNVTLNRDGTMTREVVASVGESLWSGNLARLEEIFKNPSLQMASFTVTEKAYNLRDSNDALLPQIVGEIDSGFEKPTHVISLVTKLLYSRFQGGEHPIAMVSMDNCEKNGKKLKKAVIEFATAWEEKGFVTEEFLTYLGSRRKVSFPWTMIDKITPRPATAVEESLKESGIENMSPIETTKGTFIAPFVNAERPQYLVIEDRFPNGRPPLEEAGVYFSKRSVVKKAETMKVTTCLNPLHTAMSIYGCLLGHTSIADEMKDPRILKLVTRLGYDEGLPVVANPEIIDPEAFLKEVISQRLPNAFMPDTPQRIATDTSQKMGIRFGQTIKSYEKNKMDLTTLVAIPLAIAGWFRYLLAVDDKLEAMTCSPDPMLEELQRNLSSIEVGKPDSYNGQLKELLRNKQIFGVDLVKVGLSTTIETMFVELITGKDAVNHTLSHYL